MKFLQKETIMLSLFVFLAIFDLFLRFTWLEREVLVCNRGVFWGVELPLILLFLGSFLLLGFLAYLYHSQEENRFSIALMLLGGLVNVLDRLFHGCVLDYFVWPFGLSQFLPNFNLADTFLSLGALSYLVVLLLKKKEVIS